MIFMVHYYNKKQFITNHLTNYITKKNSITNTENVLNIKKTFLRSIILQMFSEVKAIILKMIYIRNTIIEHPITKITKLSILITIIMMLLIIIR